MKKGDVYVNDLLERDYHVIAVDGRKRDPRVCVKVWDRRKKDWVAAGWIYVDEFLTITHKRDE